MMNDSEVYASAALLGAIAGMRSMTAPAVVTQMLGPSASVSGQDDSLASNVLGVLRHRNASKASLIFALGEFVADKLPFTPARTKLGSLGFRAISGAISAASICRAKGRSPLIGAVLGASAAAGTTFGVYKMRKQLGKTLHLPDPLVALAEDAIVAAAGARLVQTMRAASA